MMRTRPAALARRLGRFACYALPQVLKSKTETYSVWDRNFQLAFWSTVIYLPIMVSAGNGLDLHKEDVCQL